MVAASRNLVRTERGPLVQKVADPCGTQSNGLSLFSRIKTKGNCGTRFEATFLFPQVVLISSIKPIRSRFLKMANLILQEILRSYPFQISRKFEMHGCQQ